MRPTPQDDLGELAAVAARAESLLVVSLEHGRGDRALFEHSLRVVRLTRLLAQLPELAPERPDPTAAALAALFHDAGWVVQLRTGQVGPQQVLARPTNDVQRELAANVLVEQSAGLLPEETISVAAEALRQCNDRFTKMPEAQVVSDAENLDEIGLTYILRQHRLQHAEGRTIESMLATWQRQREYRFWEARIHDGFRLEASKALARERLAAVEAFMNALARDVGAEDVREHMRRAGVGPSQAG